jgi:ubiquinone/menaquinone biosynthesis C-methylase UbiE
MSTCPDVHEVYERKAPVYEELVSREDHQGNIFSTIQSIQSCEGKDVVEFGAGTGRITLMLAPLAGTIHAFDKSQHMLNIAEEKLKKSQLTNWFCGIAEHQNIPLQDAVADIVISGWSICYSALDHPTNWQDELSKTLTEMRRIVRPGGYVIILDSLGTGYETPTPPIDLIEYFNYLRNDGFKCIEIRTDYKFESMEEAERVTRSFFGNELADRVVKENLTILPECTGVWWIQML